MNKGRLRFAIVFLAPALILYSALIIVPMLASIYYSFTDWRLGRDISFTGLTNYGRLLGDPTYWTVLRNSFTLVVFSVVFQVSLGFVLAYVLFWIGRGFRIFQSVLFMPVVIAPIAIGLMFSILYNGDTGPINMTLEAVGLGDLAVSWLSDARVVLYAVIAPQVWQYIGLYMVICLAGMRGIPREYFDAAAIDGASRLRMMFAIAAPILREIIAICMILSATQAIRSFDHSWIMTKGGPGFQSAYFATLVYKRAFLDSQFGYGSAITVTLLLFSLAFTIVVRRLMVRNG